MGKNKCFGLNDDRPMSCPARSPKYHELNKLFSYRIEGLRFLPLDGAVSNLVPKLDAR